MVLVLIAMRQFLKWELRKTEWSEQEKSPGDWQFCPLHKTQTGQLFPEAEGHLAKEKWRSEESELSWFLKLFHCIN